MDGINDRHIKMLLANKKSPSAVPKMTTLKRRHYGGYYYAVA